MNRETLIQMARDAGILSDLELIPQNQWRQDTIRELERFATAIRAATKEEDARICHVYGGRFTAESSANDGRQSDMAFGRVVASAELADAIRASK